jgi:hypothetical protein
MSKISFTYKKDDGSTSMRTIIQPKFLKESSNYFNDFFKESVKYVQGYELDGLNESESKQYEEAINDYFDLVMPKMEDYLREQGFDPAKVKQKAFKKEGISDFKVL